jgi:hypothetical protein
MLRSHQAMVKHKFLITVNFKLYHTHARFKTCFQMTRSSDKLHSKRVVHKKVSSATPIQKKTRALDICNIPWLSDAILLS